MIFVIQAIRFIFQVITLLVIVQALLSFFMAPYHPLRQTLDRIVSPLLNPIRRILPPVGSIDFSPLILIILLNVLESVLINILRRI